jgi:hypothetical protein
MSEVYFATIHQTKEEVILKIVRDSVLYQTELKILNEM